jgi:hypothetical protein
VQDGPGGEHAHHDAGDDGEVDHAGDERAGEVEAADEDVDQRLEDIGGDRRPEEWRQDLEEVGQRDHREPGEDPEDGQLGAAGKGRFHREAALRSGKWEVGGGK